MAVKICSMTAAMRASWATKSLLLARWPVTPNDRTGAGSGGTTRAEGSGIGGKFPCFAAKDNRQNANATLFGFRNAEKIRQ
jgi:hypothetical protein